MTTREDNELVARTGPGTPCGELMRRYWQPAALSEELPIGGAPLPIRLLGEDLVLFREPSEGSDQAGRPGLLGLHCSHRRADLSFGRVEDGGLRCLYHGWLYDLHGRCLDQPAEPADRAFHQKIHHLAYPCVERAGVIFAYLGPGEAPEFSNYEFLSAPTENVTVEKYYHECNYHQGNEGNYDLSHLNFLHYRQGQDETGNGVKSREAPLQHRGLQPAVVATPVAPTPYGLRSGKIRGGPNFDGELLTMAEFVLPNFTAFIEGRVKDAREHPGYSVNWHVPIDDTHHWKYSWKFSRLGPVKPPTWASQFGAGTGQTEMVDYHPVRNFSNRFLQDRLEMVNKTFAGLGGDFQIQDKWAVEGEEPIIDWTAEHLGSMDVAIESVRRVLLKAIRDLQEGQEPANVVRNAEQNHFPIVPFVVHVPKGTDWEGYCRYAEQMAGPDGAWSPPDGVTEGSGMLP